MMCLQSKGYEVIDAVQKMTVPVVNLTYDESETGQSVQYQVPSTK